jgi:predicted DNA binding protein
LLGSGNQIMGMLRSLQKEGIQYKVISLTEANFTSGTLLGLLTEKQREILTVAFKLGYYDIPRKAGSDELARKLGIRNPTFVAHRRKAERRLIEEILKVS